MSSVSKIKHYVQTVVFMAVLTIVAISAVSALHLATADIVRRNDSLFEKTAVLQAAGLEVPADREALLTRFDQRATRIESNSEDYYYRLSDPDTGEATGYVVIREGAGLWGAVRLAVGLRKDRQTLTGIAVLKQNETPGLGARINEEQFQKQFNDKGWVNGERLRFVAEGTQASERNVFDGITGATITTRAVRDILNRTIEEAPRVLASAPEQRSD